MSGTGTGIQAALQKGLIPLLLQKLKINPNLFSAGGGKPGMPLPQGGQSDIIPGQMGGKPLGGPSEQSPQEGGGAGPQASTTLNPNARVGSLGAPVEQPLSDFSHIQNLQQLIAGFHDRKQQKQHAEAANAAQALMQAIEGAKQSNDWTPVQDILHENEKLFNKVYKGWLQKAESQKKAAQSQGKSDPDTQGFEAGIQQFMQGKQQQGPPKTMGGYYLPQASPEQTLGQQDQMAELQAREKDPGRALQDKLTSSESREAQLGAGPEKVRAEKEKAEATIKTSAQNLQKAMAESKKADLELQLKQAELQGAKDKSSVSLSIENKKLAEAQLKVDLARQRLQLQILKNKTGGVSPAASQKLKERIGASDNVIQYLEGLKGQNGFTAENITYLQGLLKQAGAVGLSGQLPKTWFGRWTSNKEDIGALLESMKDYRSNLSSTIKEAGVKDVDTSDDTEEDDSEVGDAEPQDGDEVPHAGYIYRFDAKSGQYKKTDKKAPNE